MNNNNDNLLWSKKRLNNPFFISFIIIEDRQFLVEIKAIWILVIHLSDLDIKSFGLDLSPQSPCITYISQKQCSTNHGACTSEGICVSKVAIRYCNISLTWFCPRTKNSVMQGLCVSFKESYFHLQLKECKDFSSKITLYFLERLILLSSIFEKISLNTYVHQVL